MPTCTAAERERDHDDAAERQQLGGGDDILYPASRSDAHQVDEGEAGHQTGAERRSAAGRSPQQPGEELATGDADRGDSDRVRAEALHPPGEKPRPLPKRLAHVDVSPAGARQPRGELGETQRAEQGHHAAQRPRDEGEPRPAEASRDESGRPEDAGADGHSDDHREAVDQPERAFQVGHGDENVHRNAKGRSLGCALPESCGDSYLTPAVSPTAPAASAAAATTTAATTAPAATATSTATAAA